MDVAQQAIEWRNRGKADAKKELFTQTHGKSIIADAWQKRKSMRLSFADLGT